MVNRIFIICIEGGVAVGKTSLRKALSTGNFSNEYLETIGVDFEMIDIKINIQSDKLQIWDFGGADRYYHLKETCYLGVGGGLFVFDVTRKETLTLIEDRLALFWKINQKKATPVVLVGNKIDLRPKDSSDNRYVTFEQGQRFADIFSKKTKHYGFEIPYVETSAKELSHQIVDVFNLLVQNIIKFGKSDTQL